MAWRFFSGFREAFPVKTTKRQQVELKGNRRIFVICEALSLQTCLAKKRCGWPHLVAGFREFKLEKNLKPCHGAQILFMKILCRRSSSWPQISADFTNHVETNTSALSRSRQNPSNRKKQATFHGSIWAKEGGEATQMLAIIQSNVQCGSVQKSGK